MSSPPLYRRDGSLTGYADRIASAFAEAVLGKDEERAKALAAVAPDLMGLLEDIVVDRDLAIYMAQAPLAKSLGHAGGLPVIAIGPQGGKIVGYQGGDLSKPIYAGSASAKALAEAKGEEDAGSHGLAEVLSSLVDNFGLSVTPASKIGDTYQSTVQGSKTAIAAAKSTYPGVSWVPLEDGSFKLVLDPSGIEEADYPASTVKQKGGPPPPGWPKDHPGPGAIFVKTVDGATYTLEIIAEGKKPAYVVTSPGPLFLFAGGAYGAVQGQIGDGPPVAVKFASASAAAIACLGPKEKDGKWIKKSTNGHWWWGWKGKTKKKAPDIALDEHTGTVDAPQQVDLSLVVDSATALAGEAGLLWVDGQPPAKPEPPPEPPPAMLPPDWPFPHPPGSVASKVVPNVKNGPKNAGKKASLVLLASGEMQVFWPEGGAVYDKKGNELKEVEPGYGEVFGSPTAAAQAFTGTPTNGHKWWFKLGDVDEPGEDNFDTMPEGEPPPVAPPSGSGPDETFGPEASADLTHEEWVSLMPDLSTVDVDEDGELDPVVAWLDAAPAGTVNSPEHQPGVPTWTKTDAGWVHISSPDVQSTEDLAWEIVSLGAGNFLPEGASSGATPNTGINPDAATEGEQAVLTWMGTMPSPGAGPTFGKIALVSLWLDEAPTGTVIDVDYKGTETQLKKTAAGWVKTSTGTAYGLGADIPAGLLKAIAAGTFTVSDSPEDPILPTDTVPPIADPSWLAKFPAEVTVANVAAWLKSAPDGTAWDSAPGVSSGAIYTKSGVVWGKVLKGSDPPGTPYGIGFLAKVIIDNMGEDGPPAGFTGPPAPTTTDDGEAWAAESPGSFTAKWLADAPVGSKVDQTPEGGLYEKTDAGWTNVGKVVSPGLLAAKMLPTTGVEIPATTCESLSYWTDEQPAGTGAADALPDEWKAWLDDTPPGVTFGPITKTHAGWEWTTPQDGDPESMLPVVASGWFKPMVDVSPSGWLSLDDPPMVGPEDEGEQDVLGWSSVLPSMTVSGLTAWLDAAPLGTTYAEANGTTTKTPDGWVHTTGSSAGPAAPASDIAKEWLHDGLPGPFWHESEGEQQGQAVPANAEPTPASIEPGAASVPAASGWPSWAPAPGTEYEHNGWVVEIIDHFGHPGFMVEGDDHALHLDDLGDVAQHIEAADGSPPGSVLAALAAGLGVNWPPSDFVKFAATKHLKVAKKAPDNAGKNFKIEESPAGYTVTWVEGGTDYSSGTPMQPGGTADFGSLTAAAKAVANAAVNAAVWWGAKPNTKGDIVSGVTLHVDAAPAANASGTDIFDHLFDDEVNWDDWESDTESPPGEWLDYAPDGAVVHVGDGNYWKAKGLWHNESGKVVPSGELVDGLDRAASVTVQGLGPDGKTYPKGTTFAWTQIEHTVAGELSAQLDAAADATYYTNPKHPDVTTIKLPTDGMTADEAKAKIIPVLDAYGLDYDDEAIVKHVGGSYIYMGVPLIDDSKVVSVETVVVPTLPKFPTKSNNELLDAAPLPEHSLLGLAIDADSDKIADQHVKQRLLANGRREIVFKLTTWARNKAEPALASMPSGQMSYGSGKWTGAVAPEIEKAHFTSKTKVVSGGGWTADVVGDEHWTFQGTVRLVVDANVDPRAALDQFGAKAGLGPLSQAPSEQDAAHFKALKLLYSVDPKTHDKLMASGEMPDIALAEKALAKAGVNPGDAVYVTPTPSHRTLSLQDGEKIRASGLVGVRHNWGNSDPKALAGALAAGGLMSTEVRMRSGQGGFGVSSSDDIKTGGAAGIFTYAVKAGENPGHGGFGGNTYSLFFGTKSLERADWWAAAGDAYGITNPNPPALFKSKTQFYTGRAGRYQAGKGYIGEVIFRHGLGTEELTGIKCSTQAARTSLINELKHKGINTLGGVPVEDAVVVNAKAGTDLIEQDWARTLQERGQA